MQKNMKRALIIGSNGTIGSALQNELSDRQWQVSSINQQEIDYSDETLERLSRELSGQTKFELIICCIGVLHNARVEPEKRLADITHEKLSEYYRINSILPALCLKYFSPLLTRDMPSTFAVLSAMVGSIEDNRLGGWYGYRSSKAALNMLVKTASIEVVRSNKQASVVAIHPGTTRGPLSKPYSSRVVDEKYYTPEQSAGRIVTLVEQLTPKQTGTFFNWDGSTIPW